MLDTTNIDPISNNPQVNPDLTPAPQLRKPKNGFINPLSCSIAAVIFIVAVVYLVSNIKITGFIVYPGKHLSDQEVNNLENKYESIGDTSICPKKKQFASLEQALKTPSEVCSLQITLKTGEELSKDLTRFTSLQVLFYGDESENIQQVPKEIFQLKSLKGLNFSSKVAKLPKEIGDLNQLLVLRLSDNNLKTLPSEMKQLKNLKLLDLKDTKFNGNVPNEEINKLTKELPKTHIIFTYPIT